MKYLVVSLLLFTSVVISAAKPTCNSSHGGYCQYNGKVRQIYVNKGNLILIYFDEAMDEGEWDKAGFSASQRTAAAIKIDDNPEFAKLFYSTALAAQSTGRSISFQMRGVSYGFLMIDRVWLSE